MRKILAFSILGLFLLAVVAAYAVKSNATQAQSGLRVEGRIDTPEGVRIFVKGVKPFYLKIYNSQEFGNLEELNSYIEKRQRSLERLANEEGERLIEVAISPAHYLTLAELLRIRDSYQLDIDGVQFAVFQDGQRRAATFVGEPREEGERTLVDFSQSLEDMESSLQQLDPPPPGDADKFSPRETEFKAVWVRGRLPAREAAALNDQTSIMLVDPITDLVDMFAGQAADIRVVQMPHLLD